MKSLRIVKWAGLVVLLLAASVAGAARPEPKIQDDCRFGLCTFDPTDELLAIGPMLASGNAWLGINLTDVTSEKMSELKLKEEYGAVVTEVEEDSPAAKAGLKANDVIVSYQGERVESAAQFTRLVRETPPGRSVRIGIIRDGRAQTLTATLERRAFVRGQIRLPHIRIPDINVEVFTPRPRLGISVDELGPQLAEYFGVKQGKGVLVREVNKGSAADKAGLKAGDVIVRADDETVLDVGDLHRALGRKNAGESITLGIVRNRAETSLRVQLEGTGSQWRDTTNGELIDLEVLNRTQREAKRELEQAQREQQRHWQRELQQLQRELRSRTMI